MKKWLLAVLCCMTFVGCSSLEEGVEDELYPLQNQEETEEEEKETYVMPFSLAYDPSASMHPCLVEGSLNMMLSPLMYQSLYEVDGNFKAHAVLVEEATVSDDGLKWVFTIKEGALFWDGTELTASIVASSLNEARSAESYYAPRFSQVSSVTAWSNLVTIVLSSPNYLLPNLLDIPISYGGGRVPMGTGPYEYFEGTDALYLRDPSLPLPEQIRLVPTLREEDLISSFNGGELSVLDGDLTTSQVLGYAGNYQVWEYANPRFFYLGVEGNWGSNIPTLLTLCSDAIDRENLVKNILAGYGVATEYAVHPESAIGQGLPPLSYDTSAFADRLRSLASVSFPITLLVHENNNQKMALAQEIVSQLAEFNVRVNIDARPWEEYVRALETGDFQLYVGEVFLTPDMNVGTLLSSGGTHAYSLRYDGTLEQLWRNYRLRGVEVLEEETHFFQYVKDEVKIIPLFFKNGTMLSLWGHVADVSPVANNLFYQLEQWEFRENSR